MNKALKTSIFLWTFKVGILYSHPVHAPIPEYTNYKIERSYQQSDHDYSLFKHNYDSLNLSKLESTILEKTKTFK